LSKKRKYKKRSKKERIAFRVETELKEILEDIAEKHNLTLSLFVRHIIIRWHMEFLMGHFQKQYTELRKEFLQFARNIEKENKSVTYPQSQEQSSQKELRKK